MDEIDLPNLLLGALGAVGGGLGTYLVKRRSSSGTVQTTEAKDLWAEASAYRQVLRDENVELKAELAEKEQALAAKDATIEALRRENAELWVQKRARASRETT